MKFKYDISEDDCLVFQLYTASKSESIKSKRRKSKIRIPILYLVSGLLLYLLNDNKLAFIFVVVGVLWYFIYPLWLGRYYYKHYKNFVHEKWKSDYNNNTIITIDEQFINTISDSGESKIKITELETITEIKEIVILNFKSGHHIILSKTKMEDIQNIIVLLKQLAITLKIKYEEQLNWHWK